MDAPPVQYVKTSDGYAIAYAVSGHGSPLVLLPSQFSHIELYWTNATFIKPWLEGLSARFLLIQYDGRGQGMSTRGLPISFSVEDMEADLAAVVNQAPTLPAILVAPQWSVFPAVRFALRNPKKVAGLVLVSGVAEGRSLPAVIANGALRSAGADVIESMASKDWDGFLLGVLPVGQRADLSAAVERLKESINQEDWLRIFHAVSDVELSHLLPSLHLPVLVLHPRDRVLSKTSASLAALPEMASLVHIDGNPPFGEAAQSLAAIENFVRLLPSGGSQKAPTTSNVLSNRELEVLVCLLPERPTTKSPKPS